MFDYGSVQQIVVKQETQLWMTKHAAHLYKRNGMDDLLKHAPPHMSYRAKFARSYLPNSYSTSGHLGFNRLN